MDLVLRWLPVVILFIQGLMAWGLWSLKQQFISRQECATLHQGCGSSKDKADEKASGRLNELETNIHALPSRTEIVDLGNKIEDLKEKLGKVDGRLGGINRAVDLLNQHHINGG